MVDSAIAPPAGTFELVDDEPFMLPTAASVADVRVPGYTDFDAPTVVDAAPETIDRSWSPADAPPIDVALRGETFTPPVWTTDWHPDATPAWDTPDWESATSGVWNEPDTTAGVAERATAEVPTWSPAEAFDPEAGIDDHADEAAVEVIALTSYEDLRDLPPLPTAPAPSPRTRSGRTSPTPRPRAPGSSSTGATPTPRWHPARSGGPAARSSTTVDDTETETVDDETADVDVDG